MEATQVTLGNRRARLVQMRSASDPSWVKLTVSIPMNTGYTFRDGGVVIEQVRACSRRKTINDSRLQASGTISMMERGKNEIQSHSVPERIE